MKQLPEQKRDEFIKVFTDIISTVSDKYTKQLVTSLDLKAEQTPVVKRIISAAIAENLILSEQATTKVVGEISLYLQQ